MNGTETQKPRSLWPYAIIGWFTLAITGIIIFITWAVQQRMDLVGADYYDQEIRHQQRIDSIQRTRALGDVRIIQNDATRSVTVQIPAAQASAGPEGTIRFYRPSEAALDRANTYLSGGYELVMLQLAGFDLDRYDVGRPSLELYAPPDLSPVV